VVRARVSTNDAAPLHGVTFSSDVAADCSALVITWPRDAEYPSQYMERLLQLNPIKLAQQLPQLIFLYIENTYFSPRWWSQLPARAQRVLTKQAWTIDPDRESRLTEFPDTPWAARRVRRGAA
jgi:hypothetical protein